MRQKRNQHYVGRPLTHTTVWNAWDYSTLAV